jgi:hypothetical protein
MDVAELMKLIARPPLELLFGQPAAQEQLANWMRSRMTLVQRVLQICDQLFR